MSEQIAQQLQDMGFSIESEFIPFSRSRNKHEKNPSLNWLVTLKYQDREVLTTDYMQGMAHCPAYSASVKKFGNQNSILRDDAIRRECEMGRESINIGDEARSGNKSIAPPTIDEFLYCIVSDSSVLDYGEFDSWASDYGYDPDSRKAEEIYDTCLAQSRKLQAVIGPDKLSELRELFQDY